MQQTRPPKAPIEAAALRPCEAWTLMGLSKSAFYRGLSDGSIPVGITVSGGRRWLREDVLAWLRAGAPPAVEWERTRALADAKRR